MYGKKLMLAITVILCVVSLSSHASQDLSALNMAELKQLKSSDIGNGFHKKMPEQNKDRLVEHGMQARDGMQSGMKWNTELQPYIDAHLEFGANS
jgi:hypothetical protein